MSCLISVCDISIHACVKVKDALLKNIKRRMTPQPLKIRADVELTCFHYDGIEHIKDAMRAAEVRDGFGYTHVCLYSQLSFWPESARHAIMPMTPTCF